jgi:hypothetical protein
MPKRIRALLAVYFVATLAHFAHNAEFIAKTADTDAWDQQHKAFGDDAYARGWTEWQEKRPDQRAELTLNRADSVLQ